MDNKNVPKRSKLFSCKYCNYNTSRKSQYDRHLTTPKHLRITNDNEMDNKNVPTHFECECGNTYSYISGLSKHKKKCEYITENIQPNIVKQDNSDISILTNLVLEVVKSNNEFQKQIFESFNEVMKNGSNNNNTVNNTNMINSNNKSFNLQFFLNETCKDAMNMSEFIDSVKIQLSDLESVGKLGFVDGISNIIIKNLEALEIEKRPIHCCDSKRETMYIKDQDKWEKDDNELKRMKELVRTVRDKNISFINTWRDLYPECVLSNSKKTTQFNEICMESFGGEKGTKKEKEEKIISRIAKSVIIDKHE